MIVCVRSSVLFILLSIVKVFRFCDNEGLSIYNEYMYETQNELIIHNFPITTSNYDGFIYNKIQRHQISKYKAYTGCMYRVYKFHSWGFLGKKLVSLNFRLLSGDTDICSSYDILRFSTSISMFDLNIM